jgi:excisionase family DNA binding protein
MPIEINGETYFTASEAARYLGITRPTFYQNIQKQITEYKHGALRRIYYKKADLERFAGFHPIEKQEEDKDERTRRAD